MAARDIELHASAAENGIASGGSRSIPTLTMAVVSVDITAGAGTGLAFSVWLQGSNDGGTTWFDIPYDQKANTPAAGTADVTASTNKRNIVDAKSTTSAEKFQAVYKHLAFQMVRLAWAITGTTPSFTFSAFLSGK